MPIAASGDFVAKPETRIGRLAHAVCSVTSQIFHCQGFQPVSARADRLGAHDLAYWLIFLSVLAGWFLFVFAPQRERLEMLEGRAQVLKSHLRAETRERLRLQRGLSDLARGDPQAWECAARARLGWLEPGEITDLARWSPATQNRQPGPQPRATAFSVTVLPRPQIPPLPVPPVPTRNQPATASFNGLNSGVGPANGAPPTPPAPRSKRTTPPSESARGPVTGSGARRR